MVVFNFYKFKLILTLCKWLNGNRAKQKPSFYSLWSQLYTTRGPVFVNKQKNRENAVL